MTPSDSPERTEPFVVQPVNGRGRLDLGRDIYALFGLVFDAVDLEQAVAHLRDCARSRTPCFFSTPNVNFVIAAQRDAAFRDSVLHSDLSLADGMPLIWAARLMRLPLQRVAGADVFERLRRSDGGEPMKAYFFGGPDGAAERACAVLNTEHGGLRCVGFDAPGFGAVEDMSGDDRIARIERSNADFVVVALGAKKGQAWIERNRGRWSVPLVSHLGAVVNFVSGGIARAPRWMQRVGLEWLWRVKEEPALWRRYWNDGLGLARLFCANVLPHMLWWFAQRLKAAPPHDARYERHDETGRCVMRLHGHWSREALPALKRDLASVLNAGHCVQFDLQHTRDLDSAAIALMLLIDRWQTPVPLLKPGVPVAGTVQRRLRWHGAQFLLDGSAR